MNRVLTGVMFMLTDRQVFILQAIIDDFIETAQAVGSRSLAKREDISYSPATIRNEMADLEELGFLEKTHSSSGRVPSEKGYRFYVDHLMAPSKLSRKELYTVRSMFHDKIYALEKVAQESAKLLSEFTNYTAIVLGPEVFETRLKQIQIVPLTKETVVAIIVTDTGHVEHRTINVSVDLDASDLEKLVNILNERLKGVPLIELTDRIQTELVQLLRQHFVHFEKAYDVLMGAFSNKGKEQIYFGGKTNMFSQPEFNDIKKIHSLLSIIEHEKTVYNLLRSDQAGITIKIGQENKVEEMHNCSLITATYSISNQTMGTIAVLGPTRMEYSRVFSLLELFSNDLSKALTKLYQNSD